MAATWEVPIISQLSQLDLSDATIGQVSRALTAPPGRPDEVGRKRIEHERRQLVERYARGTITEAELVAEGQSLSARLNLAGVPVAAGITSDQAVAYLRDLAVTWDKATRYELVREQADVIHAVYERINVRGPHFTPSVLTPRPSHTASRLRSRSR